MTPAAKSFCKVSPRIVIRGLFVACIAMVGCHHPEAANITLRKENQKLRDRIVELERANAGFVAPTTRASDKPSIDISQHQFGSLFVVSGLKLGKLTGEDDGLLKVYAVPTDQDGDPIKAAGVFAVDAFDLAGAGEQRIGHWEFPAGDSHKNWYGSGLLYTFVLKCPWQTPAKNSQVTVKVTFTDELTGRMFTQQKVIDVAVGGKK